MTKMSRILCVVLAFAMVLAFAACGSKNAASNNTESNEVADFVKANEKELVDNFKESFEEASGLTCDCTVSAKGNSIAFKVCIDGLDGVPEESKAMMQEAFDGVQGEFATALSDVKDEVGSVEGIIVEVCEEDGDFLASVEAKL